jgi:short-subunit dehydrogenase
VNILIVGASAGLGRCLSEEAARHGHHLLLVSSDGRDLAAIAGDLHLRYGVRAEYFICEFGADPEHESAVSEAAKRFGPIDALLYPIGFAQQEDSGLQDNRAALSLVRVNFLAQVSLTAALWSVLLERRRAFIVGFGSIASVRGRSRNVVYGAAKRALSSYFESLRHLSTGTNIHVHFYQLGYLNTHQNFGKRLPLPKASPESLARIVLKQLGRARGPVFYPWYWRPISLGLHFVPWFIYKRLQF